MPKTTRFDAADYLDTEERQVAYIAAALESGDADFVRDALGLVARARGMGGIAKKAGLNRESLYKALGETGNPEFGTVIASTQWTIWTEGIVGRSTMSLFVIAAAMMAVILLVAAWQRPRPAVIVAAILWLLYAVYEYYIVTGVLCDANCNIRVDLVLFFPILAIATVFAYRSYMGLPGPAEGRRHGARHHRR